MIFAKLAEIRKIKKEDFYHFLDAVNNKMYANLNYQKNYDDRQARGRDIYKNMGLAVKDYRKLQ